ncbi:MAG TPA: phosphate ABC transporter substrate-binding protein PstS [Gemmatimonadales bacterium]|nr:phosphate ABC transporter substrate-binding protein PstS [Gemmatimonadales bacterium]
MYSRSFAALALTVAAAATPLAAQGQVRLTGAGATFPYPVYSRWVLEYSRANPGIEVNYQSIGSGGGIRQFTDRTVDFGATDGPMSDSQIAAVRGNVLHIPTVLGAVVPAYNLPETTTRLRFTPEVLAGIFLGQITRWNDSRIAAANPGVSLPNQQIVVIHRSDGSGTTYVWTDYLSKISPEWMRRVGRGTSVNWPTGLGGRGNEGVASLVRRTPGAIGYVELVYAEQTRIPFGLVRNRAGNFVEASPASTTAAAAGAQLPNDTDFRVSITDAPGPDSYPIASFTWILIPRQIDDQARGRALLEFLWWAVHDGQRLASQLGYAPLPQRVVRLVEQRLRSVSSGGRPLLAPTRRE